MHRKNPTMADVARLAGVTSMTVSRALRKDGAVSDETRKRILWAADSLGYVLDGSAAGLKAGRTGFVAVVIPTLNNSNFAETVEGISETMAGSQLQVLLGYTNYSEDAEEQVIATMLTRRPDAIVVTGGQHSARGRRLLENAGIPVVEMWDIPERPIGHVVGFSNFRAGEMLVEHMHANGYRRVGFIGGTTSMDTRGTERRRGYQSAMARLNIGEPRIAAFGEPPITMMQGAGAIRQLLSDWPDCDAVICVSDLLAFGVLGECQRQNIAVPERLAIAGFGNYDVAECAVPALTTVDVQARAIGAAVADLLVGQLADRSMVQPQRITVNPTVISRAST